MWVNKEKDGDKNNSGKFWRFADRASQYIYLII